MDREDAISYLDRKGKDKEDEAEISKVMKEGKIYGDPIASVKG